MRTLGLRFLHQFLLPAFSVLHEQAIVTAAARARIAWPVAELICSTTQAPRTRPSRSRLVCGGAAVFHVRCRLPVPNGSRDRALYESPTSDTGKGRESAATRPRRAAPQIRPGAGPGISRRYAVESCLQLAERFVY